MATVDFEGFLPVLAILPTGIRLNRGRITVEVGFADVRALGDVDGDRLPCGHRRP